MKKLLMVAIILIASVSLFAQEYGTSIEWGYKPSIVQTSTDKKLKIQEKPIHGDFIIVKTGRNLEKTEKFYGKIIVVDSIINFEQLGRTDTFKIRKKYNFNGNTLFEVSDSKNDKLKSEFFLNEEYKYFEYTTSIERLSGDKIVDRKLYFYEIQIDGENKQNSVTKSFGGVCGYSTFLGGVSLSSVSYGAYIDFGYFGVEYHASASLNNDPSAINKYINNQTDNYVAGSGTMNFGAFYKFTPENDWSTYVGLGAQSFTEISVKNISKQENKINPYVTIGLIGKLSSEFSFKSGIIVSKCSMVNFGVGFNF